MHFTARAADISPSSHTSQVPVTVFQRSPALHIPATGGTLPGAPTPPPPFPGEPLPPPPPPPALDNMQRLWNLFGLYPI